MNFDKDDITALFGTIILHLILFLFLYFSVLRSFLPLDDGGIPVNFGDLYTSAGMYEPPPTTVPQPRQTPPRTTTVSTPRPEAKPITQEKEKTVAVPETKKDDTKVTNEKAQKEKEEAERRQREEARRRQEEAERKRKEEAERRRQEEEIRKQQEAINSRVTNAFGPGSSQDTRQGDGPTGTTNQGSPFGNSDSGPNTGIGAWGSFNLDGRSTGSGGLPRPAYNERDEGTIVIDITVNPSGDVILAEIGRGTNIGNASMRNNALNAARRAKFNRITGANNQSGTITYRYKLN